MGSRPPISTLMVPEPGAGPKTGEQVALPLASVRTLPGSAPGAVAQLADGALGSSTTCPLAVVISGLWRRTETLGTASPKASMCTWIGLVPVVPAGPVSTVPIGASSRVLTSWMPLAVRPDRKSVVEGKRGDLGG